MILACLMAAALAFSPEDAKAVFDLTDEFVKAHPVRDAGTGSGRSAARWILGRASIFGGNVYQDAFRAMTPAGMRQFVNLYCPFKRDPEASWTVFVSHYDTKPKVMCPGANDGGATSCLLVQMVQKIFDARGLKRNVMFIWTDGEECMGSRYSANDGFQGSRQAAAMLKRKGYKVSGVYVLDMLGDKDLKISIPANSSPKLAQRVISAAEKIGAREIVKQNLQTVLDDHIAFREAGFESVDLIDFEYGSKSGLNDYWHTPADTVDKLSTDSLLTVGRLVCEILCAEEK